MADSEYYNCKVLGQMLALANGNITRSQEEFYLMPAAKSFVNHDNSKTSDVHVIGVALMMLHLSLLSMHSPNQDNVFKATQF